MKKLNIWKQKVENDLFEMLSFKEEFLANNDVESNVIKPLVIDQFSNLLKQFRKYFLPELANTKLDWIQNPFAMQKQSTKHLILKSQEELADLSSDAKLRLEFSGKKLHTYWLSIREEYPSLSDSISTNRTPAICLNVSMRVSVFNVNGNQNKIPFQPKRNRLGTLKPP